MVQLVFIKDAGVFGLEIDYTFGIKDETFFQILDLNTLERILKTQIEKENFECASIIKKYIDLKSYQCRSEKRRNKFWNRDKTLDFGIK